MEGVAAVMTSKDIVGKPLGGSGAHNNTRKKKINKDSKHDSNHNKNSDSNGNSNEKMPTKGQLALELVGNELNKLFVDEYQVPHAVIFVGDHMETLPIGSKRFRNWLAGLLYKKIGMVIDGQTLKDVIGVLSADAEFDSGDALKLSLRVAESEDKNKWYYDLTNRNWEFIEISSEGWKIVKDLILFHRYSNQLPQVYPSREYPSDIFDRFINLILTASVKKEKLEEYKVLLVCYIICAFVPEIPKAVLMPYGHQGAAKTSLMEFIKMLIDPSAIKTLSFPTDINELIQQLYHNYLAFYDNISTLRDRTSDQLCRAVTGSGSSKRVLYSDDDDFIRSFKRCIGLNGINLAATKPDLLDRALFFELKRIENKDRRKIEDVWKEFERMRPQLLGAILDIIVKALAWRKTHEKLNLELPRMADWAEWCEIISRCMGNEDGAFLRAFQNNRKIQIEQIIESSQVATCLTYHIDNHPEIFDKVGIDDLPIWGFEGTASVLLEILQSIAPTIGIDTRNTWWPKAPNALSRRLNEIAHTLREAGIELEFVKSPDRNRVRTIKIRKITSISSISSEKENQASVSAESNEMHSDTNIFGRLDDSDDNSYTNKRNAVIENTQANLNPRTQEKNSKGPRSEERASASIDIPEDDDKKEVTGQTQNEIIKEKLGKEERELLEIMLEGIKNAGGSIVSVADILNSVLAKNQIVSAQIGDKLTQRENRKIRQLYADIIHNRNIRVVKHKPKLLVKWIDSIQGVQSSSQDGQTNGLVGSDSN